MVIITIIMMNKNNYTPVNFAISYGILQNFVLPQIISLHGSDDNIN
jgi:hypothetical protein